MAIVFPEELDNFTNPQNTDKTNVVSHGLQHRNANDAIEAIERILVGAAFYNVKGYGALGDGSNDDTSAIQDAIDAAETAGGGLVIFPAGTYKITSQINLKSKVSLIGAGSNNSTGATTIKQVTTDEHGLFLENTTVSNGNLKIENLRIEGTSDGTGNGIYFKNTGSGGSYPPFLYCSFRDLFISNFGATSGSPTNYGFNVEGLIVSVIERVVVQQCGNGFFINGDGAGSGYSTVNTSLTLNSCYANGNFDGIGYNIDHSTYITLNACAADDNSINYLVNLCSNINLVGCGSEYGDPTSATEAIGYKVTLTPSVAFIGCYSYQNPATAWLIDSDSKPVLIGCEENSPVSATYSLNAQGAAEVLSMKNRFTTAVADTGLITYIDTPVVQAQFTLTDGATVALDASQGGSFRLSAGGNRTISAPTNPKQGQVIIIQHFASGGARTLSLNTGSGGFRFGTDITGLTATTSGKTDYISARYNLTDDKWDVIGYVKGY